jgi:hypothetical protein
VDDFEVLSATESGLKQLTRTELSSSDFTRGTIGTDTYESLTLAGEEIDNDGIIKRRVSRWVEPGVLSQSEDFVGSQKAITIEAIGPDPSTPAGYSLARKDKSNYEGFQTNRFTFLKPSVLSRSTDEVGSQKAEVVEAFKLTPTATQGGILAKTDESNVDGIPTRRYTFLKPSVLSRKTDTRNKEKLTVETVEAFQLVPTQSIGGALVSQRESNIGGIPTRAYVWAKGEGEVSRTTQYKNKGALTVTSIQSLGTKVVGPGELVSDSQREADGYTVFDCTYALVNAQSAGREERPGYGGLATVITTTNLGAEAPSEGVLIGRSTREADGYTVHSATSVVIGSPITWKDRIQVYEPGEIEAIEVDVSTSFFVTSSGTVAQLKAIPPKQKQVNVTVTRKLVKGNAANIPVSFAYDLSKLGVSAFFKNTKHNVSLRGGSSISVGANHQSYAGYRITGSPSAEGTYETFNVAEAIGGAGSPSASSQGSQVKTYITLEGSTEDIVRSGIVRRKVDPAFRTLEGDQYIIVTEWTI